LGYKSGSGVGPNSKIRCAIVGGVVELSAGVVLPTVSSHQQKYPHHFGIFLSGMR